MNINDKLIERFSKNISNNINLSNYSWFNLGGPAEYLFRPESKNQLIDFLKFNKRDKYSFKRIRWNSYWDCYCKCNKSASKK